ncbi:hypothetical protein [Namhaeicola litoreus]|uniref:DUF2384 domain-containing protein n=1 Tax=Namhaeicola litoreus TaxID=1052145 RepID=A0ABW3Y457_9FLAO
MIADILSVLGLFGNALEKVMTKKGTRLEKKITAVGDLQKAINATKSYLVSSHKNYSPNSTLSNLWNTAFVSMVPFDKVLANQLRDKGRFWSDPKSWLNKPSSMELIPDLKDLDEKCEEMMITLNFRITKR